MRAGKATNDIIGDNASEELYYWVGPPALERGYNALLVDLQVLFDSFNGLAFRYDTEVPVGAVIDYLCARSESMPRGSRPMGRRGGGYMMTAVAHEHRIAACVSIRWSQTWSDCALFLKHVLSGAGDTESLVSNAERLFL